MKNSNDLPPNQPELYEEREKRQTEEGQKTCPSQNFLSQNQERKKEEEEEKMSVDSFQNREDKENISLNTPEVNYDYQEMNVDGLQDKEENGENEGGKEEELPEINLNLQKCEENVEGGKKPNYKKTNVVNIEKVFENVSKTILPRYRKTFETFKDCVNHDKKLLNRLQKMENLESILTSSFSKKKSRPLKNEKKFFTTVEKINSQLLYLIPNSKKLQANLTNFSKWYKLSI